LSKRFGDKSVKHLQIIECKQAKINKNKRCSNNKIKAAGFDFKYRDYESGYLNIFEEINDIENISK